MITRLSAVLGYSDYFYDAAVNIGGIKEVFYFGTNYEEYEQTSGEIRLASPTGQTLEWIVGAYYHDADLYTDQPNTFDVGKFYGIFLGSARRAWSLPNCWVRRSMNSVVPI